MRARWVHLAPLAAEQGSGVNGRVVQVPKCPPARPAPPAQVITCADFHPQHCSIFGYSTSKGCIRLADMRAAALCDQHAKMFEDAEPAVGGWPACSASAVCRCSVEAREGSGFAWRCQGWQRGHSSCSAALRCAGPRAAFCYPSQV